MNYQTMYEKMPIKKLFWVVSMPSIISMLVSSLYQIIDGIFVGQLLGSQALAAINLVMPLIIVNFSFADLIGVGSSVPIAIKLGEKDFESANNIFSSSIILIVLSSALLGGIFFAFSETFLHLMGANKEMIKLGSDYLKIYALMSPFISIMFALDNYLRICGKVKYSMFVNIFMSISIIIIEFIFLFIMKWDVWSAALASSIGMLISVFIAFIPFVREKTQLKLRKPKFSKTLLFTIFSNGFPVFLNNISGRVISIVMNVFLLRLGGNIAVAAYSVLMYIDGIIMQIIYGLCDSLQPAVGYNYGARNHDRVKKIVKMYYGVCGLLSILVTALLLIAKEGVVALFVNSTDTAVTDMAVNALFLFGFAYLVRWVAIASQSYFSAIGKFSYAAIISVAMAFVFPGLFLVTLTQNLGLNGLWLNLPLSALATAILSAILLGNSKHLNTP